MKIMKCPVCGSRETYWWNCDECGFSVSSPRTWNRLARLVEIGRLVEAMPDGESLRHEDDGSGIPWFTHNGLINNESKTPLTALRKAAKAGKWKVRR